MALMRDAVRVSQVDFVFFEFDLASKARGEFQEGLFKILAQLRSPQARLPSSFLVSIDASSTGLQDGLPILVRKV